MACNDFGLGSHVNVSAGTLSRHVTAALATSMAVLSCAHGVGASSYLSQQQIITELNHRLGSRACCFYVGRDRKGDAVYGPLNADRELHWLVQQRVKGEAVTCGYTHFRPARAFNGSPMASGVETIFIVRNRRLYLQGETPPAEFVRWEDELCGPDWVKPLYLPLAPSVR